MDYKTDDLRIKEIKELLPPSHILREFPITPTAAETVWKTRQAIHRILHGADDRLLVISGPCSIHDVKAANEYAQNLKEARDQLGADLLVLMRVYFEKPRTTVGWKGLINDPHLDGSFRINEGLRIARQLLLDLNELGVPAGCEFLDMITPQYVADLVSWGAVGARTTESQVHRELASGLSCPVGAKGQATRSCGRWFLSQFGICPPGRQGRPLLFLDRSIRTWQTELFTPDTGENSCKIRPAMAPEAR